MKPADKLKLVKNRGMIIKALDVTTILDFLVKEQALNRKEEADILSDPRRRQRATRLLDIIEQKKTETYQAFLDAIEDQYPHIYLALTDTWDEDGEDDVLPDDIEAGSPFAPARVDDEWHLVRKCRSYLIKEMDAARMMPAFTDKEVFTRAEERLITSETDPHRRTETFLDIVELKTGGVAHDIFIETLGELYPHIFLMLTDQQGIDDDDADDIFNDQPVDDFDPNLDELPQKYDTATEYMQAHGYYEKKKKSCIIS